MKNTIILYDINTNGSHSKKLRLNDYTFLNYCYTFSHKSTSLLLRIQTLTPKNIETYNKIKENCLGIYCVNFYELLTYTQASRGKKADITATTAVELSLVDQCFRDS